MAAEFEKRKMLPDPRLSEPKLQAGPTMCHLHTLHGPLSLRQVASLEALERSCSTYNFMECPLPHPHSFRRYL
jgi:hypothetical protein